MNLPSLAAIKWQLITGVAGAALLGAAGMLAYSYIENRHLVKVNADLTAAIDDPKTGFRVTLATERANRANLEAAVEKQNVEIVRQAAESSARLADTTAKLAAAQQATKRAEARAAALLAAPPKGNTVAERVADVDARVLESLK